MQRMILAALALACLFPAFALGDDRDDMFYPDNPGRLDRYSKVKSHAEAERGLEEERKRQFGRDERPKSENDKYFEELYSSSASPYHEKEPDKRDSVRVIKPHEPVEPFQPGRSPRQRPIGEVLQKQMRPWDEK